MRSIGQGSLSPSHKWRKKTQRGNMWEKLNLAHSSAAVRVLTSSKTIANQSSTPLSPPCTECVLAWILKRERGQRIFGWKKLMASLRSMQSYQPETWGNLIFFLIPLHPICPQVPLPPPPRCLSYPSISLLSGSDTGISLSHSDCISVLQLGLCPAHSVHWFAEHSF